LADFKNYLKEAKFLAFIANQNPMCHGL
jgi:hypothetical protein